MVHLGQHQTNEAKITQGPPNRLGRMLIDKTSNTVLLMTASYVSGTDTAEVEGLWLGKRPSSVCQNNQMTIPLQPNSPVQLQSSFYSSLPFYA